jgi:hypothetical protein
MSVGSRAADARARWSALPVTGLLLFTLGAPLTAQTLGWAERSAIAERHQVAAITHRRFTHAEFWAAVAPALASPRLITADVGRSMHGRALRTVTFGSGPVKVFLWSQMHGDEATATMALADVFAYLASSEGGGYADRVGRRLTVTVLPLLNPDGAELFQRENAVGIDVNRDARRLASPEAQTLKRVRDAIEPDFGFNLHDQSARTRVGNGQQAAIALLAPAADAARSYGPVRSRARLVAAWLAGDFANALDGRIAKYDDTFNPRAFGDLMQAWGASTVLIESGALPDDPQKQLLRRHHAAALLGVLEAIATEAYASADSAAYESLPFNRGGAYDLLVRGGSVVVPGYGAVRADVAINFDDSVARTGGIVREVGDLETAVALDTLEAAGRFLHPHPEALTVRMLDADRPGPAWLQLGAPARFTIRAGAEESSRETGTIP